MVGDLDDPNIHRSIFFASAICARRRKGVLYIDYKIPLPASQMSTLACTWRIAI
jgi:hypothetical protein